MIPVALTMELPPAVAARAALRPPAIVSPAPREASFGQVSGRVFAGTTRVRVLLDGVVVRSRAVSGATAFSFSLNLPARDVRIRVVAQDASGARAWRAVGPVFPSLDLDGCRVRQLLVKLVDDLLPSQLGGDHPVGRVGDFVLGIKPRTLGHSVG